MIAAERGMTLVEVVVASTIFALVMLATVTAFRTLGTTYDRLHEMTSDTAKKREVDRFLRVSLVDAMNGEGRFEGDSREISWMTPLDRVGSAGGIQHLRLRRRGDTLMLSFAPFDPARAPDKAPDWGAVVEDYALLEDVTAVRFQYRPTAQESWSRSPKSNDSDNVAESLPWAVMLELVVEGDEWPPMIVAFDQHGRAQ